MERVTIRCVLSSMYQLAWSDLRVMFHAVAHLDGLVRPAHQTSSREIVHCIRLQQCTFIPTQCPPSRLVNPPAYPCGAGLPLGCAWAFCILGDLLNCGCDLSFCRPHIRDKTHHALPILHHLRCTLSLGLCLRLSLSLSRSLDVSALSGHITTLPPKISTTLTFRIICN